MKELLNDFWKWLGYSSDEYAAKGVNWQCPKEEFYYPNYEQLLVETKKKILQKKLSTNDLNEILTVMAIDNENEDIADFIIENMDAKNMSKLCEVGISHKQPNARIQLVKIIINNETLKKQYLRSFETDKDDYIQRKVLRELGN